MKRKHEKLRKKLEFEKKIPETKHVLKENSMWRACGLFADFSRSYSSCFLNEKQKKEKKKRLGKSQCIKTFLKLKFNIENLIARTQAYVARMKRKHENLRQHEEVAQTKSKK